MESGESFICYLNSINEFICTHRLGRRCAAHERGQFHNRRIGLVLTPEGGVMILESKQNREARLLD